MVGDNVGFSDVGCNEGPRVGTCDGTTLGTVEGSSAWLGLDVGAALGILEGARDGSLVIIVGDRVIAPGDGVGAIVDDVG